MRAWALAAALPLVGCGGGAALLHGAHTLGDGKTSLGAGVSGTFLTGEAVDQLRAAKAVPLSPGGSPSLPMAASEEARSAYARGAAAALAFGPGVAPWLSARVGLPHDTEAGITFTGRAVRADARYALQSESLALSVGAGASAPLLSRNGETALQGLSLGPKSGLGSFGVDAPVLVGWRSASGVVSVWAGPRFGYERLRVDASFGIESPSLAGEIALDRVYYGGVVGMAIGFRHLYGAFELDIHHQSSSGRALDLDVSSTALSLAPAAALVAKF